jgi:hypothetical protein
MALSDDKRKQWRHIVDMTGRVVCPYRMTDYEKDALLAVAAHLAACERAMREFVRWGAMTGSDRDLFVGEFESLLAGRGSVYFTEPEVSDAQA